jgi:hypothetical protein
MNLKYHVDVNIDERLEKNAGRSLARSSKRPWQCIRTTKGAFLPLRPPGQ